MEKYESFKLLYDLYFVRTSGSKEEKKAASILVNEVKKLGVDDVKLEEFDVDGYDIKEASLKFIDPDIDVECVGVGMSSSTSKEGITTDFIYISSIEEARIADVKGKIVLVTSKLCKYDIYKEIVTKGAVGLILCTGSVYKEDKDVDLDPYMYRERHYKNGKIPAVCIRMRDAEKILRAMPKKVHMVMVEDELTNKSQNVVATIRGTEVENEVVCFTAHYDSVSFSKGAYDNATGSTCIMQLLDYFVKNPPKRTLKFIWCGSEEVGLLGSKAYVSQHKEELVNYKLNINVDMVGVTMGQDIAVSTAGMDLVNFVKYESKITGFSIHSNQGVYSSDSTPFADNGVPAMSFARIAPTGGATIHSHDDVMDFLSEPNYYRTCEFIAYFASRLVNAKLFPVSNVIPDNMKTELDYYLGRKERPEQ